MHSFPSKTEDQLFLYKRKLVLMFASFHRMKQTDFYYKNSFV